MLGCALGGYLADWCIEHLTVQADFQWFQIKVSHFRKIRVFFFFLPTLSPRAKQVVHCRLVLMN